MPPCEVTATRSAAVGAAESRPYPPQHQHDDEVDPSGQLVILVDPYSTGCCLAQEMMKRGHPVLALWTHGFSEEMKSHVPLSCTEGADGGSGGLSYFDEVTQVPPATATATTGGHDGRHYDEASLAGTVELIEKSIAAKTSSSSSSISPSESAPSIAACFAGGEAGVDFAEALSEHLGLETSNGTDVPNRRDKALQQELISTRGGLRSIHQAGGADWKSDIEPFLLARLGDGDGNGDSDGFPVVLKPTESAGSDGVKLCHTMEEAREHFHTLMRSEMVNGGPCPAVLCQEFLRGTEYVVDHVSRDGIHKTVMVWRYDKRPANGSAFVYFGCVPVDGSSPEAKILIPYVRTVLDAMSVRNGPSHGEVMMTPDGPCLVEMNCRAHGGDGNWRPLCRALTGGYSQVEATVDAYLDPASFHEKLPDRPPSPFRAFGQEVMLVSYGRGTVKSMPGFDVVKNLPSFLSLETGVRVGTNVDYTVDLITCIGSIMLAHPDPDVVRRDVDFIRYIEQNNAFFVFETRLENLKRPRAEQVVAAAAAADPTTAAAAATATTTTATSGHHHRRDFSADGPVLVRHMSNDRPELQGGGPMMMTMRRGMTTTDASKEIVVMVDPYSTGCCVAHEIMKRGYRIVCLWTRGFREEMKRHVPLSVEGKLRYHAEINEDEDGRLSETMKRVYEAAGSDLRVVACLAGGEAGVDLADALSERLNVRTNGTDVPNRRDKKVQQELIKAVGLRSIRQSGGSAFGEVERFLRTESYPVVLKPVESAGSDGVKLCHNFREAKEHFELLMESQMVNGGGCPAVLCQEFLRGKEYVVDHVSRDGVHKTVMVWVYDKRPVNGSAFVYFGCVPVESDSREARILIPYVRRVLDAMGIRNGPSHGEVIMTASGPCLVEMNCRAHGGDGNWRSLCLALSGGYSQVEASADAYLDSKSFFGLPDRPPSPFRAAGQEVILVSYSRGVVRSCPGFDVIMKLPSFVYLETAVKPGVAVDYTVDLFTGIGSVILMHPDRRVLETDVATIRQLECDDGLFVYEESKRAGSKLVKSVSKLDFTATFDGDQSGPGKDGRHNNSRNNNKIDNNNNNNKNNKKDDQVVKQNKNKVQHHRIDSGRVEMFF